MKWRKPDERLTRLLDDTIAGLDAEQPIQAKPMFGCPAYWVGGNLFAGVWQDSLMVRLPEVERRQALERGAALFEPMEGRPMKEYVVLPPAELEDPAALAGRVRQAAEYAASLPPKTPKKRKPRT